MVIDLSGKPESSHSDDSASSSAFHVCPLTICIVDDPMAVRIFFNIFKTIVYEKPEIPREEAMMNPKSDVLKISDFWQEPVQFKISVVKEGECRANHKTDDSFKFMWNTPEGLCSESFVGMYPILHSLRVLGDMRELGGPERSPARNIRIYTCPSRVIQFRIEAQYLCNLCGTPLLIETDQSIGHKLENIEANIRLRVCSKCYEEYKNRTLSW
ncbi:MAG: hypothetical protein ACFFCH_06275 [Promethearchaeota archaeon]